MILQWRWLIFDEPRSHYHTNALVLMAGLRNLDLHSSSQTNQWDNKSLVSHYCWKSTNHFVCLRNIKLNILVFAMHILLLYYHVGVETTQNISAHHSQYCDIHDYRVFTWLWWWNYTVIYVVIITPILLSSYI